PSRVAVLGSPPTWWRRLAGGSLSIASATSGSSVSVVLMSRTMMLARCDVKMRAHDGSHGGQRWCGGGEASHTAQLTGTALTSSSEPGIRAPTRKRLGPGDTGSGQPGAAGGRLSMGLEPNRPAVAVLDRERRGGLVHGADHVDFLARRPGAVAATGREVVLRAVLRRALRHVLDRS